MCNNLISKIKNFIINICKKNLVLIFLIAGGIANDLLLRAMTTGFTLYWKPIVTSISIIILTSVLALLLPHKRRNTVYVILSIFFALINSVNLMYYNHYSSFLSLSLLDQLEHFKAMGNDVTKSVMDARMLLFIIPTIVLIVAIRKLKKNDYFEEAKPRRVGLEIARGLGIGCVLLGIVFTSLTTTDLSRLVKQWNRPYLVEQLGIYSYTLADFIKNAYSQKIKTLPEEEVDHVLNDLVEENTKEQEENEFKEIFKGKDVYVIHYESAQNFAMDYETPDGPVTPFLNRLAEEGIFFNNFYPQHSVGTSSDSEFTFNTSLLPINDGTVFITHANREYVTLPKMLKEEGYRAISMHGNNGDFWNRNIMHRTLGYDRFYSEFDYEIDEEIGLGLSDMSFFRQSIDKIKELKELSDSPLMATLITLTHHYPFDDVEKFGDFDVGHLEGTSIGNYLKSYHYADRALEYFVTRMDEEGLLDNAVLVLYGDHHASIPRADYMALLNYNEETGEYYSEEDPEYIRIDKVLAKELKRTPFIIWAKDHDFNMEIDTPMGMVDALPTLSNMLGVSNPYQLGTDIMSADSNTVFFPDGDWINDKVYYLADSAELFSLETRELIEDNEAYLAINEEAEEIILLSNNIIQGDLIRYYNAVLAQNHKPIRYDEDNIS